MQRVVILGTGGTIAGRGLDLQQAWRYRAAELSVHDVLASVPDLDGHGLQAKQVAQVDSKDMGWPVWQALALAIQSELDREDVGAVVITHGTDTLEETAYLLHRLSPHRKPIVLTAAMRPATAPDADGPVNLRDAVQVARLALEQGQHGVVVVVHGRVWSASEVRKAHSQAMDAFDGGGLAPLGTRSDGWAWMSPWPAAQAGGWACLAALAPPRVEMVHSHSDADGWVVDAMLSHATSGEGAPQAASLQGLLVVGTGHGTVHQGLEAALERAAGRGMTVWRSTGVAQGGVTPREGDRWPACGGLSASQARLALVLHLLGV